MSKSEDFKALLANMNTQSPQEPQEALGVAKVLPEQENASKVPQKAPEHYSALEEALDTTESTLAPTETEREILRYVLEGISVETISLKVGVSQAAIRGFLRKPKVKEYIKELREAAAELDHMMLTSITRGIIQQRVDEVEGDLSNLTRKDTLDVIKLFSEITSQTLKGAKEDKEQDVFVNIYNQILN